MGDSASLLFFLFPKVRVAMQFTTETLEYFTCEILPLSYMKGWTHVRTIFSEIKFLGCIANKIFLPTVFRFAHLKRESEADNNNIINNSNNNSNYSNNKIIIAIIMIITNNYNNNKSEEDLCTTVSIVLSANSGTFSPVFVKSLLVTSAVMGYILCRLNDCES